MQLWSPSIKDKWNEIPLDTYRFIFERGKEKFEETISESESITNKSIQILSAITIGTAIFFNQAKSFNAWGFVIFALYLLDFIILIRILFPKNIVLRGSRPKEMLTTDLLESGFNETDKKLAPYYYEIIRLQYSIDYNNEKNQSRQFFYKIAMILSAILFVIGGIIFRLL